MKKGDVVIIAIIAVIMVVVIIVANSFSNHNKKMSRIAVIKQDGKIIREVRLDEYNNDGRIVITSRYENIITWKDGKIRFENSNCPNHVCVNTGWIDSIGNSAVCAPNRVMISIKGRQTDNIDGVSY